MMVSARNAANAAALVQHGVFSVLLEALRRHGGNKDVIEPVLQSIRFIAHTCSDKNVVLTLPHDAAANVAAWIIKYHSDADTGNLETALSLVRNQLVRPTGKHASFCVDFCAKVAEAGAKGKSILLTAEDCMPDLLKVPGTARSFIASGHVSDLFKLLQRFGNPRIARIGPGPVTGTCRTFANLCGQDEGTCMEIARLGVAEGMVAILVPAGKLTDSHAAAAAA